MRPIFYLFGLFVLASIEAQEYDSSDDYGIGMSVRAPAPFLRQRQAACKTGGKCKANNFEGKCEGLHNCNCCFWTNANDHVCYPQVAECYVSGKVDKGKRRKSPGAVGKRRYGTKPSKPGKKPPKKPDGGEKCAAASRPCFVSHVQKKGKCKAMGKFCACCAGIQCVAPAKACAADYDDDEEEGLVDPLE